MVRLVRDKGIERVVPMFQVFRVLVFHDLARPLNVYVIGHAQEGIVGFLVVRQSGHGRFPDSPFAGLVLIDHIQGIYVLLI